MTYLPILPRFAHSEAQLPRSTQSQANRDGWVLWFRYLLWASMWYSVNEELDRSLHTFFWKAIADCLHSYYIQLQSFSLYFLPFLSSGPLDKLDACFSLVICHASVFSFFWKRLSRKGTSSAWFSGDLFWLFCSLLIYFGSHIISARLSWRKYLITECQRRVPCRYFENSSVLPLSPAVSRAWCHRLGNPSLPGTVTLPTPSSD